MKNKLRRPSRVFSIVKDGIDQYNSYGLLPAAPWDEFTPEIKPITQYLLTHNPTKEELARVIGRIFEDFFSLEKRDDFWLGLLPTAEFILNRLESLTWLEKSYSYYSNNVDGMLLFSSETAEGILVECISREETVIQIEAFLSTGNKWIAVGESLPAHSGATKEEMWEKCKEYLSEMKNREYFFRIGV